MNEEIRENTEDEVMENSEVEETEKEGFSPATAVVGILAAVGLGAAVTAGIKLGKKGFNKAKEGIANFKAKHPKKADVVEVDGLAGSSEEFEEN